MSLFSKDKQDQAAVPATAAAPVKPAKRSRRMVDKRNKSLKTISITSVIIFLVILLAFNILFDKLLGSVLKWDWTPGQQYTIGDVSKEILSSMTKDVQIIGLFDDQSDQTYGDIQEMLKNYAKASKGRITVRYVDPVKFPSILTEVDPQGFMKPESNTFVVYCKDTGKAKNILETDIFNYQYDQQTYQQYLAGVTAEQSFTGAIKYVESETTPVVYFTKGHDELAYATDYSLLVTILKNNNFDVKDLETFDLTKIPDDCSTLIMAGLKKDITPDEHSVIFDYLKTGGGLMVITDFSNSAYPELNKLLAEFNIEISNDKVREGDTDHRLNNDPYTIRAIAPVSAITPTAVDGWTLVSNVRAMNQLKITKEYITVSPILTTSDKGAAETGGDATKSSEPGTQYIGLISENKGFMDGTIITQSAKVMTLGSTYIFKDSVIQASGQQLLYNLYMFYYGINWLTNAASNNNLYISPKVPTSYGITTGTESVKVLTAVFAMLILPAMLLLAALFIYRKRKHL